MYNEDSLTKRLRLITKGDPAVVDALVCEIMPELYRVAARHVRNERYIAPLTTTELVNEFWLKYLKQGGFEINDRAHFFVLVSRMMRQVLFDMARKRLAEKRGDGEASLTFEESGALLQSSVQDDSQMVEICILMEELELAAPDAAAVVDMHHFVGLSFEEITKETGLTDKQIRHRWKKGRKWLGRRLRPRG